MLKRSKQNELKRLVLELQRQTIYRIRHKFDAIGSILNLPKTGRSKRACTGKNKQKLQMHLQTAQNKSSREASLELKISKASII